MIDFRQRPDFCLIPLAEFQFFTFMQISFSRYLKSSPTKILGKVKPFQLKSFPGKVPFLLQKFRQEEM
jgi:hypothetical protein